MSEDLDCDNFNITAASRVNAEVVNAGGVIPTRKVQVVDPQALLTLFNPDVNEENEYVITQLNSTYNNNTTANCSGIILTNEQASSGNSYEMTITGMSCNVLCQDNADALLPIRPFNLGGGNYGISPQQNQTLSARFLWRPELQAWVLVS